ncbi:unnamed protein product [Owenia fusiformis]|uniref:GT23 domain-containing protein n=1 Tax=Owenia fusiformis TaxID=6347 RepID=A0A8S4N6D9_OWEFU|nr:unnamed protein product [Owenia fusiformis]
MFKLLELNHQKPLPDRLIDSDMIMISGTNDTQSWLFRRALCVVICTCFGLFLWTHNNHLPSPIVEGHNKWFPWHTFTPNPEESHLAKEVFDLINSTMNPTNCTSAKYLLCEWTWHATWGMGSLIHQITACLSAAVATNRVLQINSTNVSPDSWGNALLSPSDTCANHPLKDVQNWTAVKNPEASLVNTLKINVPHGKLKEWSPHEALHPYKVPSRFASIALEHQLPELWMVAQYIRYLIQPTEVLKQHISDVVTKIGFRRPIIGVHVRRGDKVAPGPLKEADLTPLTKYMNEIDKFVLQTQTNKTRYAIFVATDDVHVLNEARNTYEQYTFIRYDSNQTIRTNFLPILTDILLLAETDYFVGTFTSNIGLLVHELRQQRYKDGSCMAKSTDFPLYHYFMCCYFGYFRATKSPNCPSEVLKEQNRIASPIL